jgi:hypothetical protein
MVGTVNLKIKKWCTSESKHRAKGAKKKLNELSLEHVARFFAQSAK